MWRQALTAAVGMLVAVSSAASCPYTIEDGDTIVIAATAEKIRLMGYDTPEIGARAWCEAELRLGQHAAARLTALLCGPGRML